MIQIRFARYKSDCEYKSDLCHANPICINTNRICITQIRFALLLLVFVVVVNDVDVDVDVFDFVCDLSFC